ncbi:glutamine synthetase family protein [Rhizobium sp. 9140]|uniref:glutamine synthetase family protein n=1 Tax=Rhizobium sp. 9140 TaxID=1761900 RepID=UPI000795586C|nr:glutamine synthetase family protein [Rhizobium sp. 9140]CZT37145.1 glutamine synthetase [Rhizobium sp. 9140]
MNELTRPQAMIGKQTDSVGRSGFVERIGLATPEREEALGALVARIAELDLEVIRIAFVDVHGQLRIRPVEAGHFRSVARNGMPFGTALFAMDSANFIFQNVFSEDGGFGRKDMGGAGDMLAVPDLSTFRVLPWAHKTGWILSDIYLKSGDRCPFDPRGSMQRACADLAARGYGFVGGVEVECHIFKVDDPKLSLENCSHPPVPASVSPIRHGYQYMSEFVSDEMEFVLKPLRRALLDVGLPLRTAECEWGPGQVEITLDPLNNVEAADAMILLRSTVKQVARRMGLLASFMTKPGLPNVYSSGWHLHQSLSHSQSGINAFSSATDSISEVGLGFIAGLLEHAPAATAFSNPTINGYKRLNGNALAPQRAIWSDDNKAAMLRLVGGIGDPATHLENRSGEPAANPYLYMASQIYAGLDGIDRKLDPGPALSDPYAQTDKPALPKNLNEAVEALDSSSFFRAKLGDDVVNHFISTKRSEIGRFQSYVTDWEQGEYFEMF